MLVTLNQQPVYIYTGTKSIDLNQPSIVMVHGAQHDHSVWILQSRYLAHHGYNVLAVDLPGHGKSGGAALNTIEDIAYWLHQVTDTLGISACHWIGHSMGSLAVLEAAASRPQAALSVALIGTAAPMRVSDLLLNAAKDNEPEALAMINLWSHAMLTHTPGAPGPGFSVFVQNLRLMERQKPGVLLNDFSACNQYNGALISAKKLVCPVLCVTGKNDQMTPAKACHTLIETLRQVTTVQVDLIPNCGHAAMSERPDAVLDSIKRHLHLAALASPH
jgi:pimeloyl-ACP methyl ester carboxylesterase